LTGRERHWWAAKAPIKCPDGAVERVVTVALDVSELRQLQQARANLARYFPPNLVDLLANQSEPLGPARSQTVAVLFADLVGFTHFCEQAPPREVFSMLREYQALMGEQVFAWSGTLDKYTGDGLMATFGTPDAGADDACRALACAFAMRSALRQWNARRAELGEATLAGSFGLHYGRALIGNIGDERRLEFAVIGDTVNVASRLERLARRLAADIVVSEATSASAAAAPAAAAMLDALTPVGPQALDGREELVAVRLALAPPGDDARF